MLDRVFDERLEHQGGHQTRQRLGLHRIIELELLAKPHALDVESVQMTLGSEDFPL